MRFLLTVAAALVLGNFLYAAVWSSDYMAAAERSFFQTAALLIYWNAQRML